MTQNWPRRWQRAIRIHRYLEKLPAPHASYVNVDEIGSRIIPHSPAMQAEGRIAELGSGHARQTNIDRHRLHVQTVLRHPVSVSTEIFIAPGRAVAANDIDLGIGTPKRNGQIMQNIKHPRIVLANIASPVIA